MSALVCDGTCPDGVFCAEHGDRVPAGLVGRVKEVTDKVRDCHDILDELFGPDTSMGARIIVTCQHGWPSGEEGKCPPRCSL